MLLLYISTLFINFLLQLKNFSGLKLIPNWVKFPTFFGFSVAFIWLEFVKQGPLPALRGVDCL